MRKLIAFGIVLGLSTGALGCRFIKRSKQKYRDDTTALLQNGNASLKSCYDDVLKNDSSANGSVVVMFKVKDETGKIFDVKVDEANSTAPKPVQDCVSQSLAGSAPLDPPDAVEGHATYTYEFEIAPQKAPEPTSSDFKSDAPAG